MVKIAKIIPFFGILFLCGFSFRGEQTEKGMFEWNEEAVEDVEKVLNLVQRLGITRWYQEFDEDIVPEKQGEFVRKLHREKVAVYGLVGSVEWGLEEDGRSLIEHLETFVEYNASVEPEEKLDGIMLDVEPYGTKQWKEAPEYWMEVYSSGMRKAYRYLKRHDFQVAICIPKWYDDSELLDGLEDLIADACDEVAVMNYGCGDEIRKMKTEELLARRYGKKLHCILEFQEVGKHELTEDDTYRNKGLEAAGKVWEAVQKEYPDTEIVWDYHWSRPIYDMLEEAESENGEQKIWDKILNFFG